MDLTASTPSVLASEPPSPLLLPLPFRPHYSHLSDKAIVAMRDQGHVVIEPFCLEQLGTSSYDVRVGPHIYREGDTKGELFNPYTSEGVQRMWVPDTAPTLEELLRGSEGKYTRDMFRGIELTDRVILLQPGEIVLGHTLEFIGGLHSVTTQIGARSSMGRCCISICNGDAGRGDISYCNRWTLEVKNTSNHHVFPLLVGERVAQIMFYETDGLIDHGGKGYVTKGRYQTTTDLDALQRDWKPSDMLPRLDKKTEGVVGTGD